MAASSSSGTAVRILLILVAAVILFSLVTYYNRNSRTNERFSAPQQPLAPLAPSPAPSAPLTSASNAAPFAPAAPMAPNPMEPTGNEKYLPVVANDPGAYGTEPKDPFPQDRITPEQLLPKDAANSTWARANPAGQGDVKDQNFLTAGYHLGFDTQGTSLRNASRDLRSSPPCPRYRISVFNNSTIDADLSRRPLE